MTPNDFFLPFAGGALVGVAALLLLGLNGRVMGISGIWSDLVERSEGIGWRFAFVLGSIAAPVLLLLAGRPAQVQVEASMPILIVAGLLVGFGTRLGSGCTSGHGICGLARLSPRSLAATVLFVTAGVATVFVTRHLLGGQ